MIDCGLKVVLIGGCSDGGGVVYILVDLFLSVCFGFGLIIVDNKLIRHVWLNWLWMVWGCDFGGEDTSYFILLIPTLFKYVPD